MGLTDELRSMAESVGLEMPQAATLMLDAADTIEGLDADNARLRKCLSALLTRDGCDDTEHKSATI